ncbi:hypothetical protein [Sphingomonas sp.]|jgi:Iap family predicted aminopeptidase|uniref:hypothetical protein n=1 Tax=Sphingomonas sp. TaxID=28214 RepID=UPI002EDB0E70
MNWAALAGGLAAVLVLGGVVWVLRRRVRKIAAPEEAAEAADAALGGFVTVGAVVGADGVAALAVDGEGRVAVCKRLGANIAVREVAWNAIRATPAGMVVETAERRFGAVTVTGVDALDVRRLAPHLTRVMT